MSSQKREQGQLSQWRELALAHTGALLSKAGQLAGRTLPKPLVRFDLRGQSAGQVRIDGSGRGTIRYNAALLLRHGETFLARTVPHEVAHYVAFFHHGRGIRPHGHEWQHWVRLLGGEAERCHNYDTDGLRTRQTRWFTYHCRCGNHQLSSVRHNRVSRGVHYLCRRCGEALRVGPAPQD